jgi:threonine dehydratase
MSFAASASAIPTVDDIDAAALHLVGKAVETPLLEWPALNEHLGGRFLVKAEQLQRTGSFKIRGAYNKLRRLVGARGGCRSVVAFSSGNHAQRVAAAAQLFDLPATIVMPADAPSIKIDNTRQYGASEQGAAIVPPSDDFDIVAGRGTVGREMVRQVAALGLELDAVLIPCSGGGLIAGSAIALRSVFPDLPVYACEPENFDDTRRSLAAGARVKAPGGNTICDGLMSPIPEQLTFAITRCLLAGGLVVNDKDVVAVMAYAFRELKLVMELSGAVALASGLSGKFDCKGRNIGLLCFGGNLDPATFLGCLSAQADRASSQRR